MDILMSTIFLWYLKYIRITNLCQTKRISIIKLCAKNTILIKKKKKPFYAVSLSLISPIYEPLSLLIVIIFPDKSTGVVESVAFA